jgi:protein O-GlcNAc transferase
MNPESSMKVKSVQDFLTAGNQLVEADQLANAIIQYQNALDVDPDNCEGWNRLSETYYRLGQFDAALSSCQQLIKLKPNFAEAYKILGNILQAQSKIDAAVRAYTAAIQIQPNFAEAYANLGTMFYKQNRLEEAIKCYQKSVEINPSLAGVYWNLGNIFQGLDRITEANFCKQRALSLKPELGGPEFLLRLGHSFRNEEKFDEAIEHYRHALKIKADYAEAYSQLGLTLLLKEERDNQKNLTVLTEASDYFIRAIQLQPSLMSAHQGLYKVFSTRVDGDLATLQKIVIQYIEVSQEPEKFIAETAFTLIHLRLGLTEIAQAKFLELGSKFTQLETQLTLENFANVYTGLGTCAVYLRDDFEANTLLMKKMAQTYQKLLNQYLYYPIKEEPVVWMDLESSAKPLKIGVLIQKLSDPKFQSIQEVFQAFLSFKAQLYVYETNPEKNEVKSPAFETIADKIYRHRKNSLIESVTDDEEILEKVVQDDLDVLIDLESTLVPLHINLLAYQPAPVCISWFGFEPPFINDKNYFLCDGYTHPTGRDQYYIENLVRLPHAWIAVSGFKKIQDNREAIRRAYRIDSNQIVYLCTAPTCQLNSELIAAQVQILKQVPEGVLIYHGSGNLEVIRSAYQQACQSQEIGFYRIKFIDQQPADQDAVKLYNAVDIWLDSYPYNDSIQALEALWFELPVVTRFGESGVSRRSYSLLKNLNLETGISQSWDEYVQWGVKLGQEADLRKLIQQQLSQLKQPENLAPVWNPKQLAQDVYALFQELLKEQKQLNL